MFPPDLLANTPGIDAQLFYSQPSASWQAWHKPQGRSFLYMIAIGAGGGGGGGDSSGVVGGGGGGGGAIVTALIPLFAVPDILYVNVSAGGVGGLANANASRRSDYLYRVKPYQYSRLCDRFGCMRSRGIGWRRRGRGRRRDGGRKPLVHPVRSLEQRRWPGGRGGRQLGGRDHDHAGGQHDLDVRRRRRRRRRQRGGWPSREPGSFRPSPAAPAARAPEPGERLSAPRQHQRLDVRRRVGGGGTATSSIAGGAGGAGAIGCGGGGGGGSSSSTGGVGGNGGSGFVGMWCF